MSPFTPAPHGSATTQPTWFQRNWKWFVPLLMVGTLLMIAAFTSAVFSMITMIFRRSYPYQYAVAQARDSSEVARQIGSPFHIGWLIMGNLNQSVETGDARMSIPISGPRGHGHIIVVATKTENRWTFTTLEVDVAGRENPILLPKPGVPDLQHGSETSSYLVCLRSEQYCAIRWDDTSH